MKMKRVLAAIAAATVLATSAVCLTACGGDNGGTVIEQQQASIAGTTWDIMEVTVTREQLETANGGPVEMYFYFDDSTVSYYLMGETESTDYTFENGVVTIEGESSTISGNTLEFRVDGNVFKLEKR